MRGIITYIPTDPLPKGRNELHVEQAEIDDEDDSDADKNDVEYFIPFWI